MNYSTAFAAVLLVFSAPAFAQQAPAGSTPPVAVQDKTQPSPRLNPVQERAARLSTQMVRDLRLNNYQATRVRTINEEKTAKMMAIEKKNAGNPTAITQQCDAVCKERDKELQAVLSNDQYSDYYDARTRLNKFDQAYNSSATTAALIQSVQNPAPSRANNATISPAKTQNNRPAGNLGRNAR